MRRRSNAAGQPGARSGSIRANLLLGGSPELGFLHTRHAAAIPLQRHDLRDRAERVLHAGRKLAEVYGNPRLAALFPKAAIGRPGLVELMEWEGVVKIGDAVRAIAPHGAVTRRQDVLRLTT